MMVLLVFLILLGSFDELHVQALPQAKLTVDSLTITETDSVTFHCQAPYDGSVHHCYFYVNGETQGSHPCKRTFTGTELLLKGKQSSPSVVKVKCFYTVKERMLNIPSPHSDISCITIGLKPEMSVNFIEGQDPVFICILPESMKHDTICNLYFGESSHPAKTTRTSKTSKNKRFCQTEIQENELLSHLRLVQQKVFSCDYSLESDGKSFYSLRSDPYSIPESLIPTKVPTFTKVSTELTKSTTSVSISTTSAAGRHWTTASCPNAVMLLWSIGTGLTVGCVLCGSILLFSFCRTEKKIYDSLLTEDGICMADFDETYTVLTYDCKTDAVIHQL